MKAGVPKQHRSPARDSLEAQAKLVGATRGTLVLGWGPRVRVPVDAPVRKQRVRGSRACRPGVGRKLLGTRWIDGHEHGTDDDVRRPRAQPRLVR